MLGVNARFGNLLGFDRAPRWQMIETAFLVNVIPERAWKRCLADLADCLASAEIGTWLRCRRCC